MENRKDNEIVYIDLTHKKWTCQEIDSDLRRDFIGGCGINTKILYDSDAMHSDALSEKNVLIFGVGPAVATGMIAANRCTVTAKSPITSSYGDSNVGGKFPFKMRAAGIDHLVFTGKSDTPVYVYIDEKREISICDASELWGLHTDHVTDLLEEKHGKTCEVACIGPAGEKLVRFSSIIMSKAHVAGRTGMGCVMGSKNLKAIVIAQNKRQASVYDKDKVMAIKNTWLKACRSSVILKSGSIQGTLMLIKRYEKDRCIPIKNFQADGDDQIENIYPEKFLYEHETKRKGCIACPVGCAREFKINHGKYKGEVGDRIDYGAVAGVGPSVGVFDWPSILHLKNLTDQLGMDTIEIGGAIGLILECQQRGILKETDTDGKTYRFGDADDVEHLMQLIAKREGIGDLMAEGTHRAAKHLNAEDYSFCIRKSSVGLSAKSHLAKSLSYITSTRGGDHLKGYVFTSVFGGFFSEVVSKHIFGLKAQKNFAKSSKKGRVVWWHENYKYIVDSLGLCMFVMQALPSNGLGLFDDFKDLMNAIHNLDMTEQEVFYAGERIYQLQNAFNVNCGMDVKDYKWPKRNKESDIETRIVEETTIDVRDEEGMLPEYFKYRGLTSDGQPTVSRFKELNLDDYIKKAEAMNHDIDTIEDLLKEVNLSIQLTGGEKAKNHIMSSIICRLLEKKDKKDRAKYLSESKKIKQTV